MTVAVMELIFQYYNTCKKEFRKGQKENAPMCIHVTHFSCFNRLLHPVDQPVYLVIQYQPQNFHSADQEVMVVTSNEKAGVRKEDVTMQLRKL